MESGKLHLSCHSCGKEVESSPDEPLCQALQDWFVVSHWKGPGAVSRYHFCSHDCLKSWIDAQRPEIPAVFLKYFKEDENQETRE